MSLEGGSISLRGINPWEYEWTNLNRSIVVPHPSYPNQRHALRVYRIGGEDRDATVFAAGELSAGVWGFYLPYDWAHLLPLVDALRAAGTEIITDAFRADQGGWECEVRGPINLQVVRPLIKADEHREKIHGTDAGVDCLHCWSTIRSVY
ncbi:MAG: hypothetical protein ACJ74U_16090 [Jatrophihabitantaceae bacterium]